MTMNFYLQSVSSLATSTRSKIAIFIRITKYVKLKSSQKRKERERNKKKVAEVANQSLEHPGGPNLQLITQLSCH